MTFALARSSGSRSVSDVVWGVLNLLVYFFISKLVTTGVEDPVGSVLLLVRRRRNRDVPGHLRDVHGVAIASETSS